MKVRATKDGTYGGYYRTEGEVFEIDEKAFEVRDSEGNIVPDVDDNGKPKLGPGGKAKPKMATWFAKEWMEKVDEDTEVTNDYPPFQLPVIYRAKKEKPGAKKTAQDSIEKQIAGSVI